MEREEGLNPLQGEGEGGEAIVGVASTVIEVVGVAKIGTKEFVKEVVPDELKPHNSVVQENITQPILPIIIKEDNNHLDVLRSELHSLMSVPVEQPGQVMAKPSVNVQI